MYKGDHLKGEIEIVQENEVFSNKYATLFDDDVIFPSGTKGKYLRFKWNAPYGVMVLPTDSDGNVLLIKNFRHENRSWSWEIPKGFGEAHLTPLECAKKELLEETGCSGTNWELFKVLPDGNQGVHVYTVEVMDKTTIDNQEEFEAISEVKFFKRAELSTLLKNDLITDPMTMFFVAYRLSIDE